MNKGPYKFNGMPIIRSPHLPYQKVTLSADVEVTDQFRSEMNQWLLEFFGMVHCIVMTDPGSKITSIVLSETAYRKLRDSSEFQYRSHLDNLKNEMLNGTGKNEPTGLIAKFRTGVYV